MPTAAWIARVHAIKPSVHKCALRQTGVGRVDNRLVGGRLVDCRRARNRVGGEVQGEGDGRIRRRSYMGKICTYAFKYQQL